MIAIAAHRQKAIDLFLAETADCPERALALDPFEPDAFAMPDRLRQENVIRTTAGRRL